MSAAYRLTVEVTDPEIEAVLPDLPLWNGTALTQVLGSFHEWMSYALTHEQRLAVVFTLEKL